MSCDRCKVRKTKCVNPLPDGCAYCRSQNLRCLLDTGKRKQRPFYKVSEEEYRLMSRILRHQYPERLLDVNDLRMIVTEIETSPDSQHENPSFSPEAVATSTSNDNSYQVEEAGTDPESEILHLEEIQALDEDLGHLLLDSAGTFRYMGGESGVAFNAAVRRLGNTSSAKLDHDVIPPLRTTQMPPATPESSSGSVIGTNVHLPPREICFEYISRYNQALHCLFEIFSLEQFHTRVEDTYAGQAHISASWLCSLYCIFALGRQAMGSEDLYSDATVSVDYLIMAKALLARVCDEADMDSIRALILLSLSLQSHCFFNAAYLHIGTAVRIAFSLGMHVDKFPISCGRVQREHARRLWWTLYNLDSAMALANGRPSYEVQSRTALPSENLFNQSSQPNGYLGVAKQLTGLLKTISQVLYIEPSSSAEHLLSPKVAAILSDLQTWAKNMPLHLRDTTKVAPSHKRAIALLHVRYQHAIILATRPFLLASVLCRERLRPLQKQQCYERLSSICLEAAQSSLDVLKMMGEEELLSSLMPGEFNFLLELVQVFLIADSKNRATHHYVVRVKACVAILRVLPNHGWTRKARPEVMSQLRDFGILQQDGFDTEPLQQYSALFGNDMSSHVDPYDM